jgi:K+-transporting ATPase ATPase A chain
MTAIGIGQILLVLTIALLLTKPLGIYMHRAYTTGWTPVSRAEDRMFGLLRIEHRKEMDWKGYALAWISFFILCLFFTYAVQRLQGGLPLNPADLDGVRPDTAWNVAVSFATNTNWQNYGGEVTMSYLTQMLGMTVQNFVSAAAGMCVALALFRGITRRETSDLGNFWLDLWRSTVYVLLPLSFVLALALVSQGVIQNFDDYKAVTTLEGDSQVLAMGPVASQIAIKQLGTNGGGFFNSNSAFPFENATPFSNLLETLAIIVIPFAFTYLFGRFAGRQRQGWVLFAAVGAIYVAAIFTSYAYEANGNPRLDDLQVDQKSGEGLLGGNFEGKEVRFGTPSSALWAVSTTVTSNGSVNSLHDSYTPIGGLIPMAMIDTGEVVFGGVGVGINGLLIFALLSVFIAGLMVGRTPEYLGKKIGPPEMKLVTVAVLYPALFVLGLTGVAAVTEYGTRGILNPGAHGLSEMMYAFSSATGNNGSAFAGIGVNTEFYNILLGIAMIGGRIIPIIATLAIAGFLARKKTHPETPGTFPTDGPLFACLVAGVIIIVGALTFFPAFTLGPVLEHLQL